MSEESPCLSGVDTILKHGEIAKRFCGFTPSVTLDVRSVWPPAMEAKIPHDFTGLKARMASKHAGPLTRQLASKRVSLNDVPQKEPKAFLNRHAG